MEYIQQILLLCVVFGLSAIMNLHSNGYIVLWYGMLKTLYKLKNNITPEFIETINHINLNQIKNKTKIFNKTIHIYYDYLGKEYLVILPYNKSKLVEMCKYNFIAVYDNNNQVEITQQPGVPYLVSSEEIECKEIIVRNNDADVKYVYKKDKVPRYGDEILDL